MACVWAARQHGTRGESRLVALKTVLPELAEPEFESMFLDEARVAARIHHPNVCEIFELVEHEGVLALSMEWMDGDTLGALLNRRDQGPLDTRLAAHIVAMVACGLHAAHELRDESGVSMQLVHCDVSPQNILISSSGLVKVADFGVARALGGTREETSTGRVKGKMSFMSPEQAEGNPLDRRSDIFALGVVLYQATVGAHPFRRPGETPDQQLVRLLVGRVEPPSTIIPGYPAELEAIVMRAMSYEPIDRYPTADEMRRALQAWLRTNSPLITERDVARAVSERAGQAIADRAARIQRCIVASRCIEKLDLLARGTGDETFVPTTSESTDSVPAITALRPRRTTLALAAGGVIASLGLLGTLLSLAHRGTAPPVPVSSLSQPALNDGAGLILDADSNRAATRAAPSPAPASDRAAAPLPSAPGASSARSRAPEGVNETRRRSDGRGSDGLPEESSAERARARMTERVAQALRGGPPTSSVTARAGDGSAQSAARKASRDSMSTRDRSARERSEQ
jgi:serine/threonine protein kinase